LLQPSFGMKEIKIAYRVLGRKTLGKRALAHLA
jgi:hypothetical protein